MPKLYDVPRNSKIRLVGDKTHPPAHRDFDELETLLFINIDGMYSYCKDSDGNTVHLAANADVEIIR
jgi:hypothetical protein